MDDRLSDSKSVETRGSSQYPRTPFISPSDLALAAPVDEGMMLPEAARPPRQSLRLEESTTAWVAVMAWTVVMSASWMSYSSWIALTIGASPLVVQDAHET